MAVYTITKTVWANTLPPSLSRTHTHIHMRAHAHMTHTVCAAFIYFGGKMVTQTLKHLAQFISSTLEFSI